MYGFYNEMGFIMRFEDKCGFWGGRERESETLPKTHGFTWFYMVLQTVLADFTSNDIQVSKKVHSYG